MKIKFNKYERVAGLFVVGAICGLFATVVAVAFKKGWFESKVPFETVMISAEGIHPGTVVQIAGLRAGSVSDVQLVSAERVLVKFEVFERFHPQIRKDSAIQVLRPFIIGDKVLEVNVGTEGEPQVARGDVIPLKSSFDIMDVFSGKKIGPMLGTLDRLSESLRVLGDAFADPDRTKSMVRMFDKMGPMMNNVNEMAIGMARIADIATRQKRLDTIVGNLTQITSDLGQVVPAMVKETPDLGRQMGQMVTNLNVLTTEMQKLTPAIAAIAPDLPKTSLKAVEALNETVVLLKALQKSFLLRGKVEEVREEQRQPAGTSGK